MGVHLKELVLNNNKLKCIPDLFHLNNTLETLIVSNNNLGSRIKDTVYYADVIFVKHMFEYEAAGKHSYRSWTAIDKCKLNQTCWEQTNGNLIYHRV